MTPVALVTGSGKRRVGFHVAEALAEKGYAVAVHYHTSAAEAAETVAHLRTFGVESEAFAADLTDEAQTNRLVEQTFARFGRVDALVNAAAIWSPKPLEEVTAADVRNFFDANTLSTFLVSRAAGLRMAAQPEGGVIVTIGDAALGRPLPDYAAYYPSKAAIPGLTRSLAVALAGRNPRVRVNAILPGAVMPAADATAEERAEAVNATLVKREGSPRHVAQAVLFFIENDFVTGVSLPVDGGRGVYAGGT